MHTTTLLTTTALAGLALANPSPSPSQITVAPLHANAHLARNSQPRDLSPRDFSLSLDGAIQTSCALDLIDIASRMPTATKDVQDWLATAMPSIVLTEDEQFTPQLTSECAGFDLAKITPPATLSSAYSYELVE
ncbi:hypothetical protein N0V88_007376 [Collariella sp. IMI 366227]|nr:hypothetical protein N0V88_007376 [Collariella sp. IMI 366227]